MFVGIRIHTSTRWKDSISDGRFHHVTCLSELGITCITPWRQNAYLVVTLHGKNLDSFIKWPHIVTIPELFNHLIQKGVCSP